jgi:iron complex outermembrane recepter protein
VPTIAFVPPDQTDDLFSAFAEDTVSLVPGRLRLTAGTKIERNDYSDFEIQPSVRLLFNASASHAFWTAVTRPVRTPTRLDRDLVLNLTVMPGVPAFVRVLGDPGFETERSLVYEAGYRGQLSSHLSADVAAFYNRYPNLESFEPGTPFVEMDRLILPLSAANGNEEHVSGLEVGADIQPSSAWLLRAAYSYLDLQIDPKPGSNDAGSSSVGGSSPRHQAYLSSTARVTEKIRVGGLFRWVTRLPTQQVPAYAELDLHIGWRALDHVELGLAGQNLLHARHEEFGTGTIDNGAPEVEIRRSVYAHASFRW